MAKSQKLNDEIADPELMDELAIQLREQTTELHELVFECPRGAGEAKFECEHFERTVYQMMRIAKTLEQIRNHQQTQD